MLFQILQRGDQLVCPQGGSLENMLILQDTLNDERTRRSTTQKPEPTPTPTATQTQDNQPQNKSSACSQPSIISSPTSNPSVTRTYSLFLSTSL